MGHLFDNKKHVQPTDQSGAPMGDQVQILLGADWSRFCHLPSDWLWLWIITIHLHGALRNSSNMNKAKIWERSVQVWMFTTSEVF